MILKGLANKTKTCEQSFRGYAADHVQASFDYLDILEALETDIIQ